MFIRPLVFFTLLLCACGSRAGDAAVAMPDRWSADAARQVLVDGGNAVDAAVTASFVLAVTYPCLLYTSDAADDFAVV